MNPFKGRHFQRDIILWAVRWYCKYGISRMSWSRVIATFAKAMRTPFLWYDYTSYHFVWQSLIVPDVSHSVFVSKVVQAQHERAKQGPEVV